MLIFTESEMDFEDIITWVRQYQPHMSDDECIEVYKVYRDYYDEGQSHVVSMQYAGLYDAPSD
jgi:hypothetical protein